MRLNETTKSYILDFKALLKNGPRAYWSRCAANKNFGDQLTPYLIKKISGINASYVLSRYTRFNHYIFSGSVIGSANSKSLVWGAGSMRRGEVPKEQPDIRAIRGKLTYENLMNAGFDCPYIFGDPGEILSRIYIPDIIKTYRVGIIPHYNEFNLVQQALKNANFENEVLLIDLTESVEKVIDKIVSCTFTISSSLHGIVVSHAYNINSLWVRFADTLGKGPVDLKGDFKFRDYYSVDNENNIEFIELKINELKKNLNIFEGLASSKKINDQRLESFFNALPMNTFNLNQHDFKRKKI